MTQNAFRYIRQTVLPEVGQSGQERLRNSRILCVGAGGLGSPASLYLAAAGIGTLGIIDPDLVDETNLQRQVLFGTSTVGHPKVEAARARLLDLNPESQIKTYPFKLDARNVLEIFAEYDLILDGTDNFAAKFLINDAAFKLRLPFVTASLSRFEGQLSLFAPWDGPCYRCLYPAPPKNFVPNCATAGVLGALAGTLGSLQALEAIKWLLHPASSSLKPLTGKLLVLDSSQLEFFTYPIPKNPHCPLCSKAPQDVHLSEENCMDCNSHTPEERSESAQLEISASELLPRLNQETVIDVRELEEWKGGHLPGAIHFPLSRLEKGEFPTFDPSHPCTLYCHAGIRSKKALELFLKHFGNLKVKHLKGGISSWRGPMSFTP